MQQTQRYNGREYVAEEVLEALALRYGIVRIEQLLEKTALRNKRSWRYRTLLAAARGNNSRPPAGLGYGPDWKGLPVTLWRDGKKVVKRGAAIKDDIVRYRDTGIIPMYAIAEVAETIRVSELIALRLARMHQAPEPRSQLIQTLNAA